MRIRHGPVGFLLAASLLAALPAPARAQAQDAVAARCLLLHGAYAEARAAYARLLSALGAASGRARGDVAVGAREAAERMLRSALAVELRAAALHAELATLLFERGDHAASQAQVDSALAIDPDQPAARWRLAELQRVSGAMEGS